MNVTEPWSVYKGRSGAASAGRIALEIAFARFVQARINFAPHELPEIMTHHHDDGENDIARDMVVIQSEWMVDAFVNGALDTFVRPIGGGEIAKLGAEKWEIDDPIARFATGFMNLRLWTEMQADPTHRIFLNEQQFTKWMRQLQRPEHLTHEQIERIGDPSYSAPPPQTDVQQGEGGPTECTVFEKPPPPQALAGVGPRLLDLKQVQEKVPYGRTSIYNRVREGTFPDWLVVGGRSFWREDEIDRWIAEQPRRK